MYLGEIVGEHDIRKAEGSATEVSDCAVTPVSHPPKLLLAPSTAQSVVTGTEGQAAEGPDQPL